MAITVKKNSGTKLIEKEKTMTTQIKKKVKGLPKEEIVEDVVEGLDDDLNDLKDSLVDETVEEVKPVPTAKPKATPKPKTKKAIVLEDHEEEDLGAVEETKSAEYTEEDLAMNLIENDMIKLAVKEVDSLDADASIKLIPTLQDDIDSSNFKLGGVLAKIQINGWYTDLGYQNFKQFIEGYCGVAYRKAMYLISIYNNLVNSGVAWDIVKDLGWTKLKELAPIITVDNALEWVKLAKEMTTIQLQEYIKNHQAGSVEADAPQLTATNKLTSIQFKVYEDQKETIKEAIGKAKNEANTEADSVALEMICLDYLGSTKKATVSNETVINFLGNLEVGEILTLINEVYEGVEFKATIEE